MDPSWKSKFQAALKDSVGLSSLKSKSSGAEEREGSSGSRGKQQRTIVTLNGRSMHSQALDEITPPSPDCDSRELESIVTDDVVVHFVYDVKQPPARPDAAVDVETEENEERDGHKKDDGSTRFRWTRFVWPSPANPRDRRLAEEIAASAQDVNTFYSGNHDLTLEKVFYLRQGHRWHRGKLEDPDNARALLNPDSGDDSFRYLEYESTTFDANGRTWKAYGSPGSPWFGGWAFNYDRGEDAEAIMNVIPDDTDILLTHGPPYRVLDATTNGAHVGCEALYPRVSQIRPRIHVFGHIHEARGAIVKYWDENKDAGMDTRPTGVSYETQGDVHKEVNAEKIVSEGDTPAAEEKRPRPFTVFVNAAVHYTHKHQHIQVTISLFSLSDA
ncbi:hypothetical protein FRC17_006803 [Serendipita sp. 399]|nr:hypothetical protein FRC17_006803 [Serendipita sp. 399]